MTPLRQRMIEDMQVRNLSPHTQDSYVRQVAQFARHFDRSPEELGPVDIRSYQVYLTNEKKLAPGSILIAVAALRFVYRVTLQKEWLFEDIIPAPKKPQTLPVVLSPEEALRFLESVHPLKHRAILTTCYAAGLRVSEAVRLRPTDIDSQRMVIRVEQGKGQKDRYVMLSLQLLQLLRTWWRVENPRCGCSQAPRRTATSRLARSKRPARKRIGCAASPNRSPLIRSGTPSRSTCLSAGLMCARSSSCWGTAAWQPRPDI